MKDFLKTFRRLSGIKEPSDIENFTGYKRTHIRETVGNGWVSALKLNGLSVERENSKEIIDFHIKEDLTITEAKEYIYPEEKKGGIIIFSVDVNIQLTNKNDLINRIKNWFKQKYYSLINRIFKNEKLSKIIDKHDKIESFSVGNFFDGRYKSPDGKFFNETSTSIEIIGVGPELLEIIASEISKEFNQDNVLVKDYINNQIYLANKN